jgi:hypothetical protein
MVTRVAVYVTPSTLNRVIALARRSLADDAENPKFIQTVHGSGYRFVGTVQKYSSAPAQVALFLFRAQLQGDSIPICLGHPQAHDDRRQVMCYLLLNL